MNISLITSFNNPNVDITLQEVIHIYEETFHLIPSQQKQRERLRNICECTLKFERHFMGLYRNYQQK